MPRNKHIGIVGGGILGMTLALRLQESGFQVTILEATDGLGGILRPMQIGDYTWDRFYHVILMSDSETLSLLNRLSLTQQIHWSRTRTGFLTDGQLHSMSNLMEFLTFPPLNLLEKIRLGLTIFYASRIKSPRGLERVPVSQWLEKLSGKRTFQKIWLPLLKSKLGENYKITSASFIWATISRMYAARRSGLKEEMFGYVEGGSATVLKKFQEVLNEAGVEVLCQSPVTGVGRHHNRARVAIPKGKIRDFDSVILTIPCNRIPEACPQLSESEKERLKKVTYEGVVCAAFVLRKPLGGFYVTNLTDGKAPFTGVIEMTAVVDRVCFGGNSLVYLPRYAGHEDYIWKKGDDEILGEFAGSLEKMYAGFREDDVVAGKIARATEAFPVTTLNYSTELLPRTQTSLENVFVVNSAQISNGTMNVNEIVGLANRKAVEIEKLISS